MSIICMFSAFIYHRFESSFISFITISYHSCILCMIKIVLHTYCIPELFSGDLELLAIKLEEVNRNQRPHTRPRGPVLPPPTLDPEVE
ncbi:unnamed protein product [Arabidopsis halleri]